MTLDQPLGSHWRLQPALRGLVSHYTGADRDRTDTQVAARLALHHSIGRHLELRLSAGYDRRDSSDPLIPDFRKWDGGIAIGGQWQF